MRHGADDGCGGQFAAKADIADLKAEIANLRAEIFRALWIQGAGIVSIQFAVAGLHYALLR